MAAKIGEVVFKAGETVDTEELWDDSALIKAYERAVSSFKFEMEGGTENEKKSSGHNGKKKKKKRKRGGSNKTETKFPCDEADDAAANWSIGDKCLAVFSEDGLTYLAEIIEMCSDDLCVVRYCNYGNEEQQYLADLIQATKENKTNLLQTYQNGENFDTDIPEGTDSPNWKVSDLCVAPEPPDQHYHEAVINSFSSSLTCKVTFIKSRKSHEANVRDLKRSCDINHSNRNAYEKNDYNTHFHPAMSSFSSLRTFGDGIPPPPVPPPPPPVSLNDLQPDDSALASMLMSWYLSGYYTGYFKAVQQFKRNMTADDATKPTNQKPTYLSSNKPPSSGTNMDTKE